MKKSVLIFLLAFMSIGAKAQTFDWQVLSTGGIGSFTNASNTYSLAYFKGGTISGPATIDSRVYVSTRGATTIDVLSATTGAFVKSIAAAGGDSFRNCRIRATETGEIYSVGLKLGSASASSDGVSIPVSYWADENSTLASLDFPYPAGLVGYPRMGDSFEVVGSGADATFFIGGSGSSSVYIYKRNGVAVDFVRSVDLGADLAAFSISIIPNISNLSNSDFLVSHNTTSTPRKIFKYDSGTSSYISTTLPQRVHDQSVANNFSQLKYFSVSGQGYLATTGGSTGSAKDVKIFKIVGTDYSVNESFELVKTLSGGSYTYVTGNGGFSDLVFEKNIVAPGDFTAGMYNFKFYQLVTRNAISAYTLNFVTGGTLPVTLTSFNAAFINNQNTLSWTTSSEINSLGYDVESSTDGATFSKIGFVSSSNGEGVSTYSFEDKSAASGTTYYRLKQLDKDGKFKYYGIKSIKNPLAGGYNAIAVYPNPTSDYISIPGVDATETTVALYNTNGLQINTKGLLNGNKLSLGSLSAGTYVLRISKNGVLLQTSKIVKN